MPLTLPEVDKLIAFVDFVEMVARMTNERELRRNEQTQPVAEPEPIQKIEYPAILPKEIGSQLTLF